MLKGYRTQIWNCIVGTFGILEVADLSFLPEAYKGWAILVIAVVSFWLRNITTGPVGEK